MVDLCRRNSQVFPLRKSVWANRVRFTRPTTRITRLTFIIAVLIGTGSSVESSNYRQLLSECNAFYMCIMSLAVAYCNIECSRRGGIEWFDAGCSEEEVLICYSILFNDTIVRYFIQHKVKKPGGGRARGFQL